MYVLLKELHVLGVIILIGNVTITAFWKVLSDLTRDPIIIANAQRIVTVSDWLFTLSGIAFIIVGGFGAVYVQRLPLFGSIWLVAGQILFVFSGSIWLGILVPLQIRQGRAALLFRSSGHIPARYWRDTRLWLIWGIVATLPLIAALHVMIAKP
jgi:uncharacterized membrane protein